MSTDHGIRSIAVNVRGSFLTGQACCHRTPIARDIREDHQLSGSGTVYKGLPGCLHYTSSKGAIASLYPHPFARASASTSICVNATLSQELVMSETLVASGSHDEALQARVVASRALKRGKCLRICSAR